MDNGDSFQVVKQGGREPEQSPSSSVEYNNDWRYSSTLSYALMESAGTTLPYTTYAINT